MLRGADTMLEPKEAGARRSGSEREVVRAGFIPLVDSAVLVAAAEKGFARDQGIDLRLTREASWANIRDKVNLGHFDCAHMLAGMPVASSLGIGQVKVPTVAPFALGLGGNAVALSLSLWDAMRDQGARAEDGPAAMGAALRRAIRARAAARREPLTLAMVFPFSCHNYELRYWLASSGVHPDRDVRLVVIPPPLMVESLRAGQIHGFCAGSPWPGLAVQAGLGRIVTTKAEIWQRSPEKVLGMPAGWAERNPLVLDALLRALDRAAAWVDEPGSRRELAGLLAGPAYLAVDAAIIERALAGRLKASPDGDERRIDDFFVFHRNAANFPWQSHALWFYSQMVRWRQAAASPEAQATARMVYRPDLYRRALGASQAELPGASAKVEGALTQATPAASSGGRLYLGPDSFFDGRVFDPDDVEGYLRGFDIRTEVEDGAGWALT